MFVENDILNTNCFSVPSHWEVKSVKKLMSSKNLREILIQDKDEYYYLTDSEIKDLPEKGNLRECSLNPVAKIHENEVFTEVLENSLGRNCFAVFDSSEQIKGTFYKDEFALRLLDQFQNAYFRNKCEGVEEFRKKLGIKLNSTEVSQTLDKLGIAFLTGRIISKKEEYVLLEWNLTFEKFFHVSPVLIPGQKISAEDDSWFALNLYPILQKIREIGGFSDEFNFNENTYNYMGYKLESDSFVLIMKDITLKTKVQKDSFISSKLHSIGIMAGGLAHEYNNILTGIFGNLSLAQENCETNSETHQYLKLAMKSAEKAKELTRQLLTFSSGGAPIKSFVFIDELIKSCLPAIAQNSRIQFNINSQMHDNRIMADSGQLRYCFSNILKNAKDSMPQGGKINIKIETAQIQENYNGLISKNYVKIDFEDEGQGIEEDFLENIYDPFFSTKTNHMGLGLTAAHSIVKKHCGLIDVFSRVNEGTRVSVYLPVINFLEESAEVSSDNLFKKSHYKILLMDDNEDILQISAKILTKNNYQVIAVADGADALKEYRKHFNSSHPIDIVILDLTVPGGMGGVECLEQLQLIDPNVKSIVCSGFSYDSALSDYKKVGFKGRVSKPFELKEFLKVIEKVLSDEITH